MISNKLASGDYSPRAVKELLRSGEFNPVDFGVGLWHTMLEAFPCEKTIPDCITEGKRELWNKHSAAGGNPDSFISDVCRSERVCFSCPVKVSVVSFFTALGHEEKSVQRRLSRWLKDGKRPDNRLTCIMLCFALGLKAHSADVPLTDSEKATDANRFLTLVCNEQPLYLAMREEAIYYFCLANQCGRNPVENWQYACELISRTESIPFSDFESDDMTMAAFQTVEGVHDEEGLMRIISSTRTDKSKMYTTAKENCRLLLIAELDNKTVATQMNVISAKKENLGSKGDKARSDAVKIIAALKSFNDNGEIKPDTIELMEQYDLSDILTASGKLNDLLYNPGTAPNRMVLLFLLFSLDCGMRYDYDTCSLLESESLTEARTFDEYYNSLSLLLRNMGLAPLYPHRRFDFVILYAYQLFKKDLRQGQIPQLLTYYIVNALKIAAGREENNGKN